MATAEWHRTGFPWTYQHFVEGNWLAADIACQVDVEWTPQSGHAYAIRLWTVDNKMVPAPADWAALILADIRSAEPDLLCEKERNAELDYVAANPGAWSHASVYAAE